MAREDVNIKVTANVAEAIQLWKAMEAGPEGMAKALDSMGQKGKQSTKGLGDEVVSYAGKWLTVGTAVAAATKLINDQFEAVKRLREERNAATNSIDEVFNRFQVQARIPNGPEADRTRTQLLSIIANRKASPITGLSSAVELGSAGASVQDILGGGLDEFLKLTTGTNAAGRNVDQAELAHAMVLFLEANGRRPNKAGMQETSLALQQLFGGTNLQLSNLARFAPEAGKIADASHMTPVQQLALYSQFLGTQDEAMGAVAMRSATMSLAAAGANPKKVKALKQMGLTPGDVDFQGEDYFAVAERLQKGFAGIKPEQRNIAAKLLFGDEGMGFYNIALKPGGVEETRRRVALAQSTEGVEEALKTAESSRDAGRRQAETIAAAANYDPSRQDPQTVRNRLSGLLKNYGFSEWETAAALNEYDHPWFGMWGEFGEGDQDRQIRNAVTRLSGRFMSKLPLRSDAPSAAQGAERGRLRQALEQGFEQQLRGQIPIRILGPDGLDIPHEPAATGLSE